jgi:hypothetical protein
MLGVAADFVTSLFTLGVIGAAHLSGVSSRSLKRDIGNEIDAAANAVNAIKNV